jgi:hypothetical protein
MGWQSQIFDRGRGDTGWPAEVRLPEADVQPTTGKRIMTAVQATAEKVTGLFTPGAPMAPVVTARLVQAQEREAELAAKVAELALDELVDPAIAPKREKLETALVDARADVIRLKQAERQAMDRDARARSELEVEELQESLARYEEFARSRVLAVENLTRATAAATEAGRAFLAATALLQDGVAGHALPRGLILGRNLEVNVRAVKDETERVLAHVRRLVRMTIASKLGQEIEP